MKRLLFLVFLILALLIGVIVYIISFNYNIVQYDKDLLAHMVSLDEDSDLIAEYDDVTVRVIGNNVSRVRKVIGVSEREKLKKHPEYIDDDAVVLTFPDGAQYTVAPDADDSDIAYIIYSYKGKNQYFAVKGYNTYSWITRAVSLEGINSPNEIVD